MAVDGATEAWTAHRGTVMNVAYRMLGTLADAEDVAQDAWLRLQRTDLDGVADVEGWLVTTTARLCLDHLTSARVTRRAYVGPWLPDPLVTTADDDPGPAERVTLDDSVRMALLVALERLSPAQRTAWVLHDVFGLPYTEVADVVGRTPVACRQLASRARRQLRDHAPRFRTDRATLHAVAQRFAGACQTGDVEALVAVLDPDVVGWFDSGGVLPGAPDSALHGADPVARRLIRSMGQRPVTYEVKPVNGEPGVVVRLDRRVVTVITFTTTPQGIDRIHAIGNPAKLAHLQYG